MKPLCDPNHVNERLGDSKEGICYIVVIDPDS